MITIEKAIELLKQDLNDPGSVDIMDLNEAQALGIEALKRVQLLRSNFNELGLAQLPGETEE